MRKAGRFQRHNELVALVLLILLAALLRFYQLATIPVGVDIDEAVDGWEAKRVLDGECCPVFFGRAYGEESAAHVYGEEPMHVYAVAMLFRVLGASVAHVRASSAFAGLMLVPVIYLLAKELFPPANDERQSLIPVLAAFWVVTSYWHVTYSRIGMEIVYLPLLTTVATYLLWRGIRLQERWLFVLAGCFVGASLYTYRAVRFFPILLLIFLGYKLSRNARFRQTHLRNLTLFCIVSLLVSLPLGTYALIHPDIFFQREMAVSLLNVEWEGQPFPLALGEGVAKAFGMYSVIPDPQFERNPAHRPILDPISSVFFIAGLTTAWVRRKNSAYGFLFLWLIVMSLPGALAADVSPQYSRGMGALPAVALILSLGVDALHRRAASWCKRPTAQLGSRVLLASVLGITTMLSCKDYFLPWIERQREGFVMGAREIEAAAVMNDTHVSGGVWILPASSVCPASSTSFRINFLYGGALPYATLHVDETSCAQDLSRICQGRSAAIVIDWKDFEMEKAYESASSDPKGLIDFLLTKYGTRLAVEPFGAFDLMTYQLPAVEDFAIVRSFQPLDVTFGGELRLKGMAFGGSSLQDTSSPQDVEQREVPSGKNGWVVLRWQALTVPSGNYKVAVYLQDQGGHVAGQTDKLLLSNYLHPTQDWQADQREIDYYTLPTWPATAPGQYRLGVTLYDAETLQVVPIVGGGQWHELGTMEIVRPLVAAEVQPQTAIEEDRGDLAPGIRLLGYDFPRRDANPGEELSVALYWQALEDVNRDYLIAIQLTDDHGDVWAENFDSPVYGTYPTTQWAEREVLKDWHDVSLPRDIPQGDYQVLLRILEREQLLGQAALGPFQVHGRPRAFSIPDIQHPVEAALGEAVRFLGYDLSSTEVKPGEPLGLTLYWQAIDEMETSYTVFTHLLAPDNRIWGQTDSVPARGEAPTTSWVKGEIITDEYEIVVDPEAPAGEYRIEIGMYDAGTGEHAPVVSDAQALQQDRVLLGAIQVLL